MTFSGSPGEVYSARKLLTISFGILRAIGVKSKKERPEFNQSLEHIESLAQEILTESSVHSSAYEKSNQVDVGYEEIIEQINAMERNWLEGEIL
jgi:hypothetical protein